MINRYFTKIYFIGILALTACATTANYEKMLQTWIGVSEDNLISSWGHPSSQYSLNSGGKVIEYIEERNITFGGGTYTEPVITYHEGDYRGTSTTYVKKQRPIQNIGMICKTRFTINSRGTITGWTWQGNDCRRMSR